MDDNYNAAERREFLRLDYTAPIAYKVCSQDTVDKLLQGYTVDISQAGLLCRIKQRVNKDDILWVSFDRSTLNICEDLEKRSLIYQNGIIGRVVRIEDKGDDDYSVGIRFITRQERHLNNIYRNDYLGV